MTFESSTDASEPSPGGKLTGRKAIVAWLIVLGLLALAAFFGYRWVESGLNPTKSMRRDLAGLRLPTTMRLVANQAQDGPCFFGCGLVTNYYVSSESLDASCRLVQDALEEWGVTSIAKRERYECSVNGTKGHYSVNAEVTKEAQVPGPGGGATPISEPHEAVVIIDVTKA